MIAVAGFLAVLAVAPGPVAPGAATSVGVVQGRLVIEATGGATNRITVTERDRTLYVGDVVPVVSGPGCQRVTQFRVACLATGVGSVSFQLGAGDDSADFQVAIPVAGAGGTGSDSVWGGSADDTVYGGPGADNLAGNGGADHLDGGADNDHVTGGADADQLYGDTGLDKIWGGSGADYLAGGDDPDQLYGDTDADTLDEPFGGSNKLTGGWGDDTIIGSGNGMRDMVIYSERLSGVAIGVNLSDQPYDELAGIPAGTGGELAGGTLVEQDAITGVTDIATGDGDDFLIAAHPTAVLLFGTGTDRCDRDGTGGIELVDCTELPPPE